jgi:hypothetical protein
MKRVDHLLLSPTVNDWTFVFLADLTKHVHDSNTRVQGETGLIQGVLGGIVNILGGGSMDYSE